MIRLGGDEIPRSLLAVALEWAAERLGAVAGGCALLSPRHEPLAWAWGSADAGRADCLARLAERLQHCLFPSGRPSALARRLEADPAQPAVLALAAEDLGDCAEALARHRLAPPLLAVLREEGRVAGVVWLAAYARRSSPSPAESARALRLVQPLLELALRDRRYRGEPGAGSDEGLGARELTPRQRAVARLAVAGLSNREIAARLQISEQTVKNHMTRVLAECGVRSRAQLIALFGMEADAEMGLRGESSGTKG